MGQESEHSQAYELSLLLADCRQALFDAIKIDDGASNATRFEVGRAIGLLGRVIEQEGRIVESGVVAFGQVPA